MTKLKTIGVIGAVLLGTSTLALAQTGSTGSTYMGQPSTAPQGGSHPATATPQAAPPSRAITTAPSAAPGAQTAMRMTEQDAKKRLEDEGYSSVTDLKTTKDGYSGRAMMAGKRVTVDVDGNGKITSK